MSKDGVSGATQKTVGAIKEAAGKVIGDRKLQAEGRADRVAGGLKQVVGRVKDAIRKAAR